jgi:predicted transcriptional regulator of viral defense system
MTNIKKIEKTLEYYDTKFISKTEIKKIIRENNIINNIDQLIYKLIQKKRLVKIKNKLYLYIPFKSINNTPNTNEFEINEKYLGNLKYYIGLWNAYNLHDFTTQIPNKLYVFNNKYQKNINILNYNIVYIKTNKLYGIINKKYPYSNKEKTIIDVLNYFKYIGNLKDIIENIKTKEYDEDKLITYAKKEKSIKLLKLIGIITENKKLYNYLKNNNKLNYYTYIRNSKKKEVYRKWKIKLI